MAERNYFDEKEAEEILRLASRKENPLGGISRNELERSAAELGISPEALREAELQIAEQRQEADDRKKFRQYQRGEILSDFGKFMAVGGFLIFLDLFKDGRLSWAFWPVGIWGMVMLGSMLQALIGTNREKEFERWQRKQRPRQSKSQRFELDREVGPLNESVDESVRVKG